MKTIDGVNKIVMKEFSKEYNYIRAKSKVDNLKRLYLHIAAYIIINCIVSIVKIWRNMNNGESFNEAVLDFGTFALWMVWGIAVAIHLFSVFGLDYILGKDWEAKRLKKYMDEDNSFKS